MRLRHKLGLLALLACPMMVVAAHANDFPTIARAEFILGCMNKKGVQSYTTLYNCSCVLDRIAERMSYADYAEAQTFMMLRSTPGEKGGVFRDPPRSAQLRETYQAATTYADNACS